MMQDKLFKLSFFVPVTHVEVVKSAIFAAGAGRMGSYDACSWQTLGEGQFRPLSGSNPFIGSIDVVEKVPEYKVETVCTQEYLSAAVAALRASHPYEEPALEVWELMPV